MRQGESEEQAEDIASEVASEQPEEEGGSNRQSRKSSTGPLQERSTEELQDLAEERQIERWDQMSREELLSALR